jgi:hypothetical protein
MEERPVKRARGLLASLQRRESTARLSAALRSAPFGERREAIELDSLVGLSHPAARSVILGFTSDGEHLLSYTFSGEESSGGGYVLELWRMPVGAGTLGLAFSMPVFACGTNALDFGEACAFSS